MYVNKFCIIVQNTNIAKYYIPVECKDAFKNLDSLTISLIKF